MCRCSKPLETAVKEKISMFCHVEPEQVLAVSYNWEKLLFWDQFVCFLDLHLLRKWLNTPNLYPRPYFIFRSSVYVMCPQCIKFQRSWRIREWWIFFADGWTCPLRQNPAGCLPSGKKCHIGQDLCFSFTLFSKATEKKCFGKFLPVAVHYDGLVCLLTELTAFWKAHRSH